MKEQNPSAASRGGLQRDLLASLVVFLVALPLCMGIALASGAPIATGLVTGIVGGIVVGSLGGAPLQVSGPAAGLTVIVGDVIRQHGLPTMGVVVMVAGVLQLIAGLCKLGQWFRAVSPAVIHGMLSGIGVLIVSSQIHVMVDDRPRGGGLANILSIPEAIRKGLPIPALEDANLRRSRLELLQRFGQLHQRQIEIESHLERIVGHSPSIPHADSEASHLAPFAEQQRALQRQVEAALEKVATSPILTADGQRAERLRAALAQAHVAIDQALGDLEARRVTEISVSQQRANGALAGVLANLKSHDWAAKMGLLSIAIIMLWQVLAPRRLKLIPGPLLAVVAVTAVAYLLALPVLYVEVPENLLDGLTLPAWSVLREARLDELLMSGLIVAVVASAETLLCATAVDRMHRGPRTQYDRELAAQGVGNFLCGILGALPMTGVIVRSAANVQAGAQSRLSTILHGIWLLLFVVALGSLLRLIPTAALAGILVYTGFKLIDIKGFRQLWTYSRSEALIFLITVVVIVVEDLLMGVITGILLSAIKLLVTFSRLDLELIDGPQKNGHPVTTLRLAGAATFLRLPILAAKLEEVPRGAHLHVDFEQLEYIDHACLELLMNWVEQHESSGGMLTINWDSLHARFQQRATPDSQRVKERLRERLTAEDPPPEKRVRQTVPE